MLLDYARPSTPQCKRGLAVMTGAAGLLCAAIAIWCAIHAVHVVSGLQYAGGSFCGTCYEAMVAALGMPLHHTLSLGVFSGGCALVAGIQSIRFANAARGCGGARAA
jgi:hypothetical protein